MNIVFDKEKIPDKALLVELINHFDVQRRSWSYHYGPYVVIIQRPDMTKDAYDINIVDANLVNVSSTSVWNEVLHAIRAFTNLFHANNPPLFYIRGDDAVVFVDQ